MVSLMLHKENSIGFDNLFLSDQEINHFIEIGWWYALVMQYLVWHNKKSKHGEHCLKTSTLHVGGSLLGWCRVCCSFQRDGPIIFCFWQNESCSG